MGVGIGVHGCQLVKCVIVFGVLEQIVEAGSDDLAHAVPIKGVVPMLVEVYAPVDALLSHVVNGTQIMCEIIQQFLPTSGSISVDADRYRVLEQTVVAREDDGVDCPQDVVSGSSGLGVERGRILIVDDTCAAVEEGEIALTQRQVGSNLTDTSSLKVPQKGCAELCVRQGLVEPGSSTNYRLNVRSQF